MDIEVKFVLSRLACIVHAVRWGMMTPKAIEDAKLAADRRGNGSQSFDLSLSNEGKKP